MGLGGKVCRVTAAKSWVQVTIVPRRYSMSWMVQIPGLLGQILRPRMVSRVRYGVISSLWLLAIHATSTSMCQVSELWGNGTKQDAGRHEDIGDKILGVLSGDKGKEQKQKEAQRNWFATKVSGGSALHSIVVFTALFRSTRWLGEVRPES